MSYKILVSDVIKQEYTKNEEKTNLQIYRDLIEKLKKEEGFSETIDLNKLVSELLSTINGINVFLDYEEIVFSSSVFIILYSLYFLENNLVKKPKEEILEKLYVIYKKKNRDYGNSAEKQLKLNGSMSFKPRLEDKVSRLYSFSQKEEFQVEDETILDTLYDLINYCMIYCIWVEKSSPRINRT